MAPEQAHGGVGVAGRLTVEGGRFELILAPVSCERVHLRLTVAGHTEEVHLPVPEHLKASVPVVHIFPHNALDRRPVGPLLYVDSLRQQLGLESRTISSLGVHRCRMYGLVSFPNSRSGVVSKSTP